MGESETPCDCKIGRNRQQYGLTTLDTDLRRERHEGGASLRELAALVNRRLLEARLHEETVTGLREWEILDNQDVVESAYDALTSEDPTRRARVKTRLERTGIDVEALRSDWVTHPTVRAHLRNCLGVDTSETVSIDEDGAVDTVEWARARSEAVIERTLDRLATVGLLAIGDLDVVVSVRVTCTACGDSHTARDIISRGRCSCHAVDE